MPEAQQLLKATLADWGITTDWITKEWVSNQFQHVSRSSTAGGEVAINQDEFQAFCASVMNFLVNLGPVMESMGAPAPGVAAAYGSQRDAEIQPATGADPAAAAEEPPPAKGGCCSIS